MLRWIGINLRTFILAFALAVAVWVTAVTAANPDVTQPYPEPITIEYIGQDPGLVMTASVPRDVEVILRAPRSIWDELTSGNASIHAVVDLTGLNAGTHSVTVQTQIGTRPVRLLSVSPETFDLTLERLVSVPMPVELSLTGEPAIGYKAGVMTVDPMEVIVSGPELVVKQVEHLQAVLDITNARQSVDTILPVDIVTSNNAILTRLTIHPTSIHVTMPVAQQGGYRDMAVKVITVGKLASGYRLKNVTASPLIVTVFSQNIALIQSLPGFVETASLDLSGASGNIERKLSLNLPGGVTLIGDQTVTVQIEIVPIEGSLTIAFRPVEVVGLATGLTAQLSPITVDVILAGPLPVLETLSPSDVTIEVDLTGLGIGTYQVTPKVSFAKDGVTVQSILPGTVEVIIERTVLPTP